MQRIPDTLEGGAQGMTGKGVWVPDVEFIPLVELNIHGANADEF
jgi:hypothetical protein